MSKTLATGVPDGTAELPPTPVTNPYHDVANRLTGLLNEAVTLIPHYEPKHRATAKFVRTYAKYPNGFLVTVVSAVTADPELQQLKKFDPDEAIDALRYNEAFGPIADFLSTLATNVKFSCDSKKAKPVAGGLQIYAIAKGLGRDPGSASIAAHVENMNRDLNGFGRRKSKSKEVPAPTTNTVQ